MSSQQTNNGSIGFFGLLGIIFIVLKLIGTIDWSWYWVLSPLHLPFSIIMTIGGVIFTFSKEKSDKVAGWVVVGVIAILQAVLYGVLA